MELLYWIVIIALFVVAFIGLVYPIIPSVLFIVGAFLLYGIAFSFAPLNIWFWLIQGVFVLLLFIADYLANIISVKKFGGSNASVWGSTIGILIGPFVIPVAGIILGPFLGAIIAEMLVKKQDIKTSIKIGVGSVVGLFSSAIVKGVVQAVMIIYFFIVVL